MTLPTKNVLGILADNLRSRGRVMHLAAHHATAWAEGLSIPRGGETVLYTGHMYQLLPAMGAMARRMADFEESWITSFFGLGRIVNKAIDLSAFMAGADPAERAASTARLRGIARLLRQAGVEFGYLYDEELYAGALVHDGGVTDAFEIHARRVAEVLRRHDVRRVICVDPHTLNVMRSVLPEVVEGWDVEVTSYLEVLAAERPALIRDVSSELAVHDSCVYARFEGVVDQPRQLLSIAGVELREPRFARRMTHCCGGPVESLFPSKAHAIAEKRIEQLVETGAPGAVTMCPICLLNLRTTAGEDLVIRDISEVLVEAYCPAEDDHERDAAA